MEELLKKLLEAEILTPETKQELNEAFEQHVEKTLAEAKEEAANQVRLELTEQWVKEREVMIEAIDSKVGELLDLEVAELKEDISAFRDLEAEYAEKLVEARATMAEELKSDMAALIESVDGFIEERLAAEFQELAEDIEEVKKNEFGRKIFEAYASEFNVNFIDEESLQAKLHESQSKLQEAENKLTESAQVNAKLLRESKMVELLSPLNEYQREVMSTILETTATEKLESTFKTFIGRVVKESVDHSSEKESEVLAESEKTEKAKEEVVSEAVVKTGDSAPNSAEVLKESQMTAEEILAIRRLSGLA